MSDLRAELARAEQERARLDTVIDYLRERVGEPARMPVTRKNDDAQPGRRLTAAKAAEQVLQNHDGPMKTPDILKEIQAMGATMKDADGLYKTLTRSPRFIRTGRGLWKLT